MPPSNIAAEPGSGMTVSRTAELIVSIETNEPGWVARNAGSTWRPLSISVPL